MADDNSRVTVAVLKSEMSHLALTFQSEIQHLRQDLERNHKEVCKGQEDHEQRLRTLEGRQSWSVWRDLGAYLTAIGAGIAGALSK